ncbi:hypothetical protein AB0L35_03860 [Streptomyces sp. NPDC052309]|uniref:FXSXX-COOH protein n=1 Tax=Streptomyces griseicoloratus TaxID=2752516 RepID=A0A926QT17_9ACTN|nr:hypothetical protein [Streptomyces griseicoloratus]MBD0422395.1 hypothetical protein [Streptomyces griseicoloratus]
MAEQVNTVAGSGGVAGRTTLLPGLTDVDLRTLRAMDEPALMAAVEQVFEGARGPDEIWYSDEGRKRVFSAGLVPTGEPPQEPA